MQRNVPMFYDPDSDRWCVELDGTSYGLHCGEGFEIYLGQQALPCRIEMDREWYLIVNGTSFNLRKSSRYRVNY
ncbi:DUF5348 domain-containing protein [Cohnella massiliensis]|uniref:DUF5348 domain-containing protein n=1 Tax=Cohnella massiliensis TaxID=1816691 RepID=UPI001FE4DB4B|nr:DUF5348 domain-containing protein [Cohnella massiliensis]